MKYNRIATNDADKIKKKNARLTLRREREVEKNKYRELTFFKTLYNSGELRKAFESVNISIETVSSETTGSIFYTYTREYKIRTANNVDILLHYKECTIQQSKYIEFKCKIGRKSVKYAGNITTTPKYTGFYQSAVDTRTVQFENAIIKLIDMLRVVGFIII